jgi:hypothetical protein
LGSVLVSLNENLANSNRTAAVSQSLFHCFTSSHDGHATDLSLEHKAFVSSADWGSHVMLDNRKVVETFFNKKPDDSIRVKDEVCALSVLIANHAASR